MAIWSILWPFGLFYGHLVHFMAIWYIFWPFGIFFPFWQVAARKIWQPCFLAQTRAEEGLGELNGV
jgi:hypothetical protein